MAVDVIIIGGGVIGLLSALRLKQAGLAVEVFEKCDPATESSWAGLGVLSPEAAAGRPLEYVRLTQASLALYPALADELRAESNIDIDLRHEGLFNLALDEADGEELRENANMQGRAGVPVKWVEDRSENLMSTGFARDYTMKGAIAASADGRILGVRVDVLADHGAFNGVAPIDQMMVNVTRPIEEAVNNVQGRLGNAGKSANAGSLP